MKGRRNITRLFCEHCLFTPVPECIYIQKGPGSYVTSSCSTTCWCAPSTRPPTRGRSSPSSSSGTYHSQRYSISTFHFQMYSQYAVLPPSLPPFHLFLPLFFFLSFYLSPSVPPSRPLFLPPSLPFHYILSTLPL